MQEQEDFWIKILQIVIIPIVVAVIAILWNNIQNWHRRNIFQKLIFRELEEISPYNGIGDGKRWYEYLGRQFVHQSIFDNPTENRDFILSLDPELVYYLSQLWFTYKKDKENKTNDGKDQWLHYLGKIADYAKVHDFDKKGKIQRAYDKWIEKIDPSYGF